MYLQTDLHSFNLSELPTKFDVVLIEPPLEEYQLSYGVTNLQWWNWDEIMNLDIAQVSLFVYYTSLMIECVSVFVFEFEECVYFLND